MPGVIAPQRARTSRKPTGLPNPPMILLAGPEKTGKSRIAAEGTASELLGTTYWIEIGGSEGTADYYGRLPGANYTIVPHDGSYQDILDAVRWAVAQPPAVEGKRNMIVLDSVTVLWDMLSDEQALYARWRAEKKAQQQRRRGPNPDLPVTVDPDLWNRAKDRWGEILWHLRRHTGPTLLLARQELVTAFENDKPTRDRTRKIKAEKNLPAAVDAIVELHALGEAYLTGVRTLHWEVAPGHSERLEDFSIDTLLRRMGFHEAAAARQVTETRPEAYLEEQHPQQQRQTPTPQEGQRPSLTGDQAASIVRQALENNHDPESCLHAIREEWGTRTLQGITIKTPWGMMNADRAITRSLEEIKARSKHKQHSAAPGRGQSAGREAPTPDREQRDDTRPRPTSDEPGPPPTENDVPPPPDPKADEPPLHESPEDTSAAEEPQHIRNTAALGTPKATRRNRNEAIALKALHDEADVQARIKKVTVGEHLGPISEEGDPPMTVLRDHLHEHRPEIIAQLEREGHADLAQVYRKAPIVDPQIRQKFTAYFEGAPAGQ